jgi:hypothetical protein
VSEAPKKCVSCDGESLYTTTTPAPSGFGLGSGLNPLPGIGGFTYTPTISVVVCHDCGHIAFFANASAREKVAKLWKKV